MKHNRNAQVFLIAVVLLTSLACGGTVAAQPTTAPSTDTSVPPTATERPTSTPRPSATPDVAATEFANRNELMLAQVQEYIDAGYLTSNKGDYFELADFEEEWAQLGWYQWWEFEEINLRNFVISAHFNWSSALSTTGVSGCGIIFAINDDGHHYGMFLDKSRIQFTTVKGGYWYEVGKTSGTGRVDFGNPAEADVSMVVNEYQVFVLVNNEFIGEYSLSKEKPMDGRLGFGLLSGTNKDYGTRCEMTNVRLWKIE